VFPLLCGDDCFSDSSFALRFRALGKEDVRFVDVIRGGSTHNIRTQDVVAGDIVVLTWGKFIPADGYIISSDQLKVAYIWCVSTIWLTGQTG
jgi:magnesium-transporting ATPase (P-type)